jgi:hypothetical protein
MEQNKVTFFEVRTFDDLIFTSRDISYIDPTLSRATVDFDTKFGDGTWASVVYGGGTYSTKGDDGEYDSFEVWYSDEEEPRGYETVDEINLEFLTRSFKGK